MALLTPSRWRARTENLVSILNSGHRTFQGGMQAMFHTNIEIVTIEELSALDQTSIQRACDALAVHAPADRIDTVLAYTSLEPRTHLGAPYNQLKLQLAQLGYASQMLSESILTEPDWKLMNLALGIFSKAGATPWVLRDALPRVDMFLGIEMSHPVTDQGRAGGRCVAFVNIFDSYSRWRFMDGSARPVRMEERLPAIEAMIRSAVTRARALRSASPPRDIVIHYFKRLSEAELSAIKRALAAELNEFRLAIVALTTLMVFEFMMTPIKGTTLQGDRL